MTAFSPGDVACGGKFHYVEIIKNSDGSFSQFVHVLDAAGADTQQYITGVTFRPSTGDLYTTSTPDLLQANTPHDVDWFPDDSGLLVAVVPSSGTLQFKKYDFDGNVLQTWTPAVESGWAQEPVKISIACDSKTVFYTQSKSKIQRYDVDAGSQLTDYETLAVGSPYRYGGIRVLPGSTGDDRDVVVAMTITGSGPYHAVCLAPGGAVWSDEINPLSSYHVYKRSLADGTLLLSVVTEADPVPDNDETLSLACYFDPCAKRRASFVWITS